MKKKVYLLTIIPLLLLFFSCKDSETENFTIGAIAFANPDHSYWAKDSSDTLSKFYPEYKELKLTITPVLSFSAKDGQGVIVISKAHCNDFLKAAIDESSDNFRKRAKHKNKIIEQVYQNNELKFKHLLFDSKITFSRVFVTENLPLTNDVVIIDFICPPDQYQILSPSFEQFVLSFSQL